MAEHTATVLEVLRGLDSGPRGLTEAEALERLARYGPNTLPAHRTPSWPRLFARSLRDPFTAVLACLGLVSALVLAWGTTAVILLLVAVSCALRAGGEHRADRSLAGLRALVATTATVLRRPAGEGGDGGSREIPVDELVPGDVVRLGPGDLVPADVRLLRASGLTVHQAALTGESAPVPKSADPAATGSHVASASPASASFASSASASSASPASASASASASPASASASPASASSAAVAGVFGQPQLCFQGSSVASGSATAVVVATGARTRFATGHGAAAVPREASAFDRSVHGISWILIRFMLLTPPLVLMAGAALRGRGAETLPFAVAVAVGLTPEMLPVLVTVCLARGATRLARAHDVVVKRLPALHDAGAVDVLCVDKTGTLTQDRPVVDQALGPDGRADADVLHWAAVGSWWTLQLADLPVADALDEAVLDTADADGLMAYDGVAALPYDPVRRLATAVVRTPGRLGTHTLIARGDVEAVLERCAFDGDPDGTGDGSGDPRARLRALAAREAEAGLRVLAVATAERPARPGRGLTPADERGLTFRGLITLRDALAPTAARALDVLAGHGVTVKVLTGDHPGTAARACRDLGVPVTPEAVLTADRLDGLDDAALADLARRATVLARCTPEHKARVVRALRGAGHTVGFLGDGVNDLPALRAADVGIAPQGAAGVAREAADVVLADKDLTAVARTVRTGRLAGGNIATYLRVTLSSNLGNVIAMLCAGLLLPFLPMLPAQVLVQNLCFDAAQLAFADDRPHPSVLRRPTVLRPRDLLRFIAGFGVLNAVADLATFGVLAYALHGRGLGDDQEVFHSGWFTENLLTQALVMTLLRIGRRPLRGGRPGPVAWAAGALAVIGLLLPASPLGPPLGLTALPTVYYPLLIGVLVLYAVALRAASERRTTPSGPRPKPL
ncbi:magnesium-translocating P-type ATPase [Streptomyces mangrovisoli]|uniref:Magnesium-transporting ATPase, P-type 1 n=1 Tax=Streptomyces mangrovisoli TaxID=1428628 RepID=A0A1J4P497_9ACTN|nr:magnesium-translocating P-type ATPase [Streptomyces mangrovisoli]OIJ69593.1 magnesium-translocating P-type ATPase [Streptomyces mangrovisoli]